MNLHTWDFDVSSNPSILKTRKRGGVLWREEECLFKNDCFFKKDELNIIFGKKQDREIITGLEPDLGESPVPLQDSLVSHAAQAVLYDLVSCL